MNHAKQWKGEGCLWWAATVANEIGVEAEQLDHLRRRRESSFSTSNPVEWVDITTVTRLALGLANPFPAEASGLCLHHTYGFPIIPASSIKGVVRYALGTGEIGQQPELQAVIAAQVAGDGHSSQRIADILFGASSGDGKAGWIQLHDGWPVHSSRWFSVDVLTPHHPKYYAGNQPCPSDGEDPKPLHFLVIREGVTFTLGLSLTRRGRKKVAGGDQGKLLRWAKNLVLDALIEHGLGARTAAGFGCVRKASEDDTAPAVDLDALVQDIAAAAANEPWWRIPTRLKNDSDPLGQLWASLTASQKASAANRFSRVNLPGWGNDARDRLCERLNELAEQE